MKASAFLPPNLRSPLGRMDEGAEFLRMRSGDRFRRWAHANGVTVLNQGRGKCALFLWAQLAEVLRRLWAKELAAAEQRYVALAFHSGNHNPVQKRAGNQIY
jgi:hypothetical protein